MKKRLLLLGGGYEQLIALRIAKELDAEVIVFDGKPDAICRLEADEYRQVNIKDRHDLLKNAEDVQPDGVFVHAAELAVEVAQVANHLGLPGISEQTALLGSEKTLRAACLTSAGIRTPKFIGLGCDATEIEWIDAAKLIDFPLVAKPTRLAGARGVEFIDTLEKLKNYYQKRQIFPSQDFQIEEFVSGVQLSTESVIFGGRPVHTSVALRHYDTTSEFWPSQIEDGHSMPWADNGKWQPRISEIVAASADALQMENGVLKGDLVITDANEIIVLEMAVRTSGGRFCDAMVPVHSGINILYPLIQMALGAEVNQAYLSASRNSGVSQRFLILPAATPLKQKKEIQHILLQPDVFGYWFRDDFADLTHAPDLKCHGDRMGYVMCTGKDRLSADFRARQVIKELSEAVIAKADR